MIYFHSILLVAALLHQAAAGVVTLERRAINCKPGGGKSPCVCGSAGLGIKRSENKCPDGKFVFVKPTDFTTGTMHKVAGGRDATLQCDHVVEAQFVADQFVAGSAMCNHFASPQGKADFEKFKDVLNTASAGNFVFLDTKVNNAKGKLIGNPAAKAAETKQIALGVASYLSQIESRAKSAAQEIFNTMEDIAKKNNFQNDFPANFAANYDAKIKAAIAGAKARAAVLPAKAATTSTKRKKPPTTPAGGAPPAKKQKTGATTSIPKTGTAAKAGKKTTAAKKPTTGSTAKKTAAKVAPKKTTVKKAPIKKTTARKAPVRKTTARKKKV